MARDYPARAQHPQWIVTERHLRCRRGVQHTVVDRGQAAQRVEKLARTNNTLILPSNLGDIAGLVASALTVVKATGEGGAGAGTSGPGALAAGRGSSAGTHLSAPQGYRPASPASSASPATAGRSSRHGVPGGMTNIDVPGFGRSQPGN